jgi:hypothetical protein
MGKVEVGSKWVEVGAILSICGEESMGGEVKPKGGG